MIVGQNFFSTIGVPHIIGIKLSQEKNSGSVLGRKASFFWPLYSLFNSANIDRRTISVGLVVPEICPESGGNKK